MINLLYSLGVPISYFKKAQERALEMVTSERVKLLLNKFARVLQDSRGRHAVNHVSQEPLGGFDPKDLRVPATDLLLFGLIKGRNIHEFISLAFKNGIDLINDPILCGIINCLQVSNYQQIKKKGRICVPDSANLLGVIDDTGTLAPNEVFIQIKRNDFGCKSKKKDPTISQIVREMVARNKNKGHDFHQAAQNEEEKKSFDIE